jgi:cell division protein ZapE
LPDIPGRRGIERVHFHDFMLRVHASVGRLRAQDAGDPVGKTADEIAARLRVLAFDELQVTDIADAMILGRLFERLLEKRVTVIATTNRPPRDLYKNGLNRQIFLPFIAMLEREMTLHELKSDRDYRLDRLMAAPVWHAPLNARSEREMDGAWDRLTLGAHPHPQTIDMAGRSWIAERTAAGCARFSFDALCDVNLGPADYLEVARRFHTVLLEDIPLLKPDRRDAARRFVTLIDTLYEARTKLVASAAAEPVALYPEGDGAFEFERTVSRLMEMRSQDYLAATRD